MLKEGVISEEVFLNLFATEKQKEKYKSSGNKFVSNNKQTVLKQAARLCEIKELGSRRYEIMKVYSYPVPKNFNKMNSGIHQYLTPLILINLIAAKIYELENITFTCLKWHRMVDMINDNYINMRYNIDYSSNKFSLDKQVLWDFFNTTNDTLVYYFKKSLEYLKIANLFNYQEINWVCVRQIVESRDVEGKQKIQINHIHRRAQHNEMEFIRRCEQMACQYAGINTNDDKEKFYGEKSVSYLNKLKELLLEHNILFCYKAYEIYSTDKDIQQCYHLLNSFGINKKSDLVLKLNSLFQKNLIINAQKRILEKPEKRQLFSKTDINNFIKDYKKIVKLTLDYEANKLEIPNLLGISNEEYVNKIISDNLHISFNGKLLNIGVDQSPHA